MPTPRHLRVLLALLCTFLLAHPAGAHIGTAGIFVQGSAGPYPVYVTVTPPAVYPGQAVVSVVTTDPRVTSVSAQANVLTADASAAMPEATPLQRSPAGTHEFHGTSWIMTQGSWQVRILVQGAAGQGSLAIPLPASPTAVLHMTRRFGAWITICGLILLAGLVQLAAALVREAQTDPGTEPTPTAIRAGRKAAALALTAALVILIFFDVLWRQEIKRYTGNLYHPLAMKATLTPDQVLHLKLASPGILQQALATRRLDDLVLDHNHLMHLYVVRWPAMDVAYHLHPDQLSPGAFDLPLPTIPPGQYRLFADIVHADGFPETLTTELPLNIPHGRALIGDDARGDLPAVPQPNTTTFTLPDGYTYHFTAATPGQPAATQSIHPNQPVILSFTLLDPAGHAPAEMHNYMGMLGHAAIIKQDGTVFAHIHPEGSVAMAAYMMANASQTMSMNQDPPGPLPNTVAFPFGFPSPGPYRILIQMKHGTTVETGAIGLTVQ